MLQFLINKLIQHLVRCAFCVELSVHMDCFIYSPEHVAIYRCPECEKLKPEFVKAAAVLKDHDPPVVFAQVCTFMYRSLPVFAIFIHFYRVAQNKPNYSTFQPSLFYLASLLT